MINFIFFYPENIDDSQTSIETTGNQFLSNSVSQISHSMRPIELTLGVRNRFNNSILNESTIPVRSIDLHLGINTSNLNQSPLHTQTRNQFLVQEQSKNYFFLLSKNFD